MSHIVCLTVNTLQLCRYAEFHIENEWNAWVLMLTLSLSAWRASLTLHQHPEYIASIASNAM